MGFSQDVSSGKEAENLSPAAGKVEVGRRMHGNHLERSSWVQTANTMQNVIDML